MLLVNNLSMGSFDQVRCRSRSRWWRSPPCPSLRSGVQIKSKAAFFAFLLLSGGLGASAASIGNFNELAPTEIASHDGGAENSLEEDQVFGRSNSDHPDIGSDSFSTARGMDHLTSLSRRLRGAGGGGMKDVDSAGVFTEVTNVAKAYVAKAQYLQRSLEDGDNKGIASAINTILRESGDLARVDEASNKVKGTRLAESFRGISDVDLSVVEPDSWSGHLKEYIGPQVFDQIVEHGQVLVENLEAIDKSLLSLKGRGQFPHGTPAKHASFNFKPSSFDSNKFDIYQSDARPHLYSTSGMKRFLHERHIRAHSRASLPRLSKNDDTIASKHSIRLNALSEALGEDVCRQQCEIEDMSCNCKNLFDCAQDLTYYDYVILLVGGYVDTSEFSDSFGNFTVENLKLFANEDIRAKMDTVNNLVATSDSSNLTECTAVLEEFHSACDPVKDSCTQSNQQTFQVTIENICNAVDTPTKLLFEVIGDSFDGFDDNLSGGKCMPLSFEACAEFVMEFDRLYEGRSTDEYPASNPMRRESEVSLTNKTGNSSVFQNVQFPLAYKFDQDENGVFEQIFSEPGSGDRGKFALISEDDGAALGIDGNCVDGMTVTVQNFTNNEAQHFRLDSTGRIISAVCHNLAMTANISASSSEALTLKCINTVGLVLKDTYADNDFRRNTQLWRFYSNGSIRSIACPHLELTNFKERIENPALPGDRVPFSIVNPSSGLSMGIDAPCRDGELVRLQNNVVSSATRYKLACGSSRGRCRGQVWEKDVNERHEVRCCADSRLTNAWTLGRDRDTNVCRDVWGESRIDDNCYHDQTLAGARGLCERIGGRLCTVAELQGDCTRDTGCGHDDDMIWSSDPAPSPTPISRLFKFEGDGLIVPLMCPDRVVQIPKTDSCSNRKDVELWPRSELDNQRWTVTQDGSIQNVKCRNLASEYGIGVITPSVGRAVRLSNDESEWRKAWKIATTYTDNVDRLYGPFSMVNPSNRLAIGVVNKDCQSGRLQLQHRREGDLYQQFYLEASGTIFSAKCVGKVVDVLDGTCRDEQLIGLFGRTDSMHWNIREGSITSDRCSGYAISIQGALGFQAGSKDVERNIVLRSVPTTETWDQEWYTTSTSARLSMVKAGGGLDRKWAPKFRPDYNYALLPQFTGQQDAEGCISSGREPRLGKDAMHICDASMILLLGATTSVGTLRAIAKSVNEEGPGALPGTCCLDNAANSQFFGYAYDPKRENMICQNKGVWHLGISHNACATAGGQFFRNPCVTLKNCIQSPSNDTEAYSRSFQVFADRIRIDDPNDESSCQRARRELGFDQDYDFDTEICAAFNEMMCDPFFTEVDHLSSGSGFAGGNRTIMNAPPAFPDDPALTSKMLPAHGAFVDPATGVNADSLSRLGNAVRGLEISGNSIDRVYTFVESNFGYCNLIPAEVLAVPNPAYIACVLGFMITLNVLQVITVANDIARQVVDGRFGDAQLGESDQIDQFEYTKELFNNFKTFDHWINDALGVVNENIVTQHSEMRQQLQQRHQQMLNDLADRLCKIFQLQGGTCVPNPGDGELPWTFQWPEGQPNVLEKLHQIESKGDNIEAAMERIQHILSYDAGDTRGDEELIVADRFSKIAAVKRGVRDVKPQLDEIEDKMDGFETDMKDVKRNVDAVEGKVDIVEGKVDAVEGKVDAVEGKVDAVEGKVDAVEGKVDVVEGKVDAVEGKVDALAADVGQLKDMMSRLIEAMG